MQLRDWIKIGKLVALNFFSFAFGSEFHFLSTTLDLHGKLKSRTVLKKVQAKYFKDNIAQLRLFQSFTYAGSSCILLSNEFVQTISK